ncbi:unnamed protein product [Amoebophrya sp. A120]|nr:unnamed protein product [Amoebophrya sp. A120]|eukprot:GSA120T00007822001.1
MLVKRSRHSRSVPFSSELKILRYSTNLLHYTIRRTVMVAKLRGSVKLELNYSRKMRTFNANNYDLDLLLFRSLTTELTFQLQVNFVSNQIQQLQLRKVMNFKVNDLCCDHDNLELDSFPIIPGQNQKAVLSTT